MLSYAFQTKFYFVLLFCNYIFTLSMEEYVKEFEQEILRNDHDAPEAIIAIQSLIKYIEQSNVGTLQQLIEELQV